MHRQAIMEQVNQNDVEWDLEDVFVVCLVPL